MNVVLWIMQFLLAGVFVFAGGTKVFTYDELSKAVEVRSKGWGMELSRGAALVVGLLEIAGALLLVLPYDPWPPDILLRLAAAGLALLMVGAGVYHVRRKESATPSIVLFLMAVFVIVGRWPR